MNRLDRLRKVLDEVPRAPTTYERLKQSERAMEEQGDANVFFGRPDPQIVPPREQEASMPFGPGTYGPQDFSQLKSGGFGATGAMGPRPMGNPGGMPMQAQGTPSLGAGRPILGPVSGGIPPQVLQMLMARAGGQGQLGGGAPLGGGAGVPLGGAGQGGPDIGAILALLRQRQGGFGV
jgi:hypothetical protein